MPLEPESTALILAGAGILLLASTLFSGAAGRTGIPVAPIFLGLGLLAGELLNFENYRIAFRLGAMALVLILFDGGINTPVRALRSVFRPSLLLATVGVAGTAVV